jgi:hypothetical protein
VNELDTLSINHNWLNAHNVHHSWALLQQEHRAATAQLEDCRCVLGRAAHAPLNAVCGQDDAKHPRVCCAASTTQHNTTQHNTTQHNTTTH